MGTDFRRLFEARPNTIPTLDLRMNQNIFDSEINVNRVTPYSMAFETAWILIILDSVFQSKFNEIPYSLQNRDL